MRRRAMLLAFVGVSLAWIAARRRLDTPPRAMPEAASEAAVAQSDLLAARPDLPAGHAAILLLSSDQKAAAAASALESAGVPFGITKDPAAAARHRLIVIPFGETVVPLTPSLLGLLRAFVERGGALVVQTPSSKDPWAELTGLSRSQPSRRRQRLVFKVGADPGLALLSISELAEIPLSAPGAPGAWTRGLQTRRALGAEPIAVFETGEAAILRRRAGAGAVYTLGVDLRDVTLRYHAARGFDAGRIVEGVEPAADAIALTLLGWYQAAAGPWARLRAVPGRSAAMLSVSHAVETVADENAALALAEVERQLGLRATWFFRAGSAGVSEEASVENPRVMSTAKALADSGHEVASHGVLHAADFEALREGQPPSDDDAYRPTLGANGFSRGAALLAEAAVSRRRIERVLGQAAVAGFRTPGLTYPTGLASALEKSGYLYDSSLTQRDVLSARPFRLPMMRRFDVETSVIELPVAFNDEQRARRLDAAAISRAVSRSAAIEGLIVWAVRPSAAKAAESIRLLKAGVSPHVAWLRLVDVARFWRARSLARFSLSVKGREGKLSVDFPAGAPGLAFELSGKIKACRSPLKVSCEGNLLVINAAEGASGQVSFTFD